MRYLGRDMIIFITIYEVLVVRQQHFEAYNVINVVHLISWCSVYCVMLV